MIVKRQRATQPTDCRYIQLSQKLFAIVDTNDYEKLKRYRWRLYRSSCCLYAARRFRRNGHEYIVKMHRVVAKTPQGYECHHKNHDTLDNRKCNLENLLPAEHAAAHGKA